MRRKIPKFMNIYVVTAFIGVFSFLYMLSFAFVLSDVSNGSSVQMNKQYLIEKKELCRQDPSQC